MRDREVFEFTHIPDKLHRCDGVDTQEAISKGVLKNLELVRMLQNELIEEKIRRGELQGCSA
ncbi:hypothetical protein [Methanoculleus horonobensis]|uniref:hypothetical protein n=1 Tax=Methanoculleus horonobensis TaxID=528314 RepID=UPI00082A6027|nr:hypothetical protein [Methanoculleus horonobensis]